jgi:hypothetical protein
MGEYHREVFEPDWQENRYPDLKGLPEEEQRSILYDKMVSDAVIAIQTITFLVWPLYFIVLLVVPTLETVAAGYLLRRYQRPWLVALAYAERIIPLALSLVSLASLVYRASAMWVLADRDWFGTFQRSHWPMEALTAALIVVQIAAWRSWPWPLRLVLHAAWIGVLVYMVARQVG